MMSQSNQHTGSKTPVPTVPSSPSSFSKETKVGLTATYQDLLDKLTTRVQTEDFFEYSGKIEFYFRAMAIQGQGIYL